MVISVGDGEGVGEGEGVVTTWLIVGVGSTCLGRVRMNVIPAVRTTEVITIAGNCQEGRAEEVAREVGLPDCSASPGISRELSLSMCRGLV